MHPAPVASSPNSGVARAGAFFGRVDCALRDHWAAYERQTGARPARTFLSLEAFESIATAGGPPRSNPDVFEAVITRGSSGETVALAVDFGLEEMQFRSESDERPPLR